jgi:hypothetical protein
MVLVGVVDAANKKYADSKVNNAGDEVTGNSIRNEVTGKELYKFTLQCLKDWQKI